MAKFIFNNQLTNNCVRTWGEKLINKKAKFLFLLLFLLIIAIPVSFAADNATAEAIKISEDVSLNDTVSVSNDDGILRAGDVYFDASDFF